MALVFSICGNKLEVFLLMKLVANGQAVGRFLLSCHILSYLDCVTIFLVEETPRFSICQLLVGFFCGVP